MTIFVLLLVVSILLFIMTHYEQKARLAQEYNQKAENAAAANEAKSAFLSDMSHEIAVAKIAGKGTFYRLQAGHFATRDMAAGLCVKLKAQKQECVPVKVEAK